MRLETEGRGIDRGVYSQFLISILSRGQSDKLTLNLYRSGLRNGPEPVQQCRRLSEDSRPLKRRKISRETVTALPWHLTLAAAMVAAIDGQAGPGASVDTTFQSA